MVNMLYIVLGGYEMSSILENKYWFEQLWTHLKGWHCLPFCQDVQLTCRFPLEIHRSTCIGTADLQKKESSQPFEKLWQPKRLCACHFHYLCSSALTPVAEVGWDNEKVGRVCEVLAEQLPVLLFLGLAQSAYKHGHDAELIFVAEKNWNLSVKSLKQIITIVSIEPCSLTPA